MACTRQPARQLRGAPLLRCLSVGVLLLAVCSGAIARQEVEARWLGPDGEPLPFTVDEEVLAFLGSAQVLSMEPIPEGITRPRRVLLEADGVQARAVFRVVEERHEQRRLSDGRFRASLRDSADLEVAAYGMARLLGLETVPPTVERRIGGEEGTLQLWIENAFTETVRVRDGLRPPDTRRFNRQVQTMYVFDALIGNDDRNTGNILYEEGTWELWMIDHTRTFQITRGDLDLTEIYWCERGLWERLQTLERGEVEEALGDYLSVYEIDSLFERRDELVAYIQRLIDDRGSGAVLF